MLWRNDGFDDVSDVVYIGKCFDAEQDVIKGLFGGVCGFLWCSNDSVWLESLIAI